MTPPAGDELAAEFRRLVGVSSVIGVVAGYVDDLAQFAPEEVPDWLNGLGVPPRWRIASLEDAGIAPARIAVCGQRLDGRWDGCETVRVFRFTGEPPGHVIRDSADSTLRGLGAQDIQIRPVSASLVAGVTAVRSDGFLTVAGERVWAQYTTYVASSTLPGQGCLVQQSITINAECHTRFAEDIAQLSNALQCALLAGINGR